MSKISAEDKIYYCKQYLEGKMNLGQIANIINGNKIAVQLFRSMTYYVYMICRFDISLRKNTIPRFIKASKIHV